MEFWNAGALAAAPRPAKRDVDLLEWAEQAIPASMTQLPRAFALALGQLSDPAVLRVLGKTVLATLAVFVLLGLGVWQALSAVLARYAAGYQELGGLIAIALTVIGGWLLFRVVALAVLQFFADDVVRAVERRHYPDAAAVPDARISAELAATGKSLLRLIAVNAVVLPLALLLLVTGVGTAVAEGKEVKTFDGQDYILERGIFADLAVVKAWKADETGNLVFRKTARNFNLPAATCGKVCVVEVEEIVPIGSLDPDCIHLPGVYVQRMIVGAPYDKKIEFRTVREKAAA